MMLRLPDIMFNGVPHAVRIFHPGERNVRGEISIMPADLPDPPPPEFSVVVPWQEWVPWFTDDRSPQPSAPLPADSPASEQP